MRRMLCAAAMLALSAGRALAQTPPPAPPPAAVKEELGRDLFGEAEPNDEGRAVDPSADQPPETTPAPAGAPPPSGIHPDASTAPYDARVRESFQAGQQFQGPLDGGWRLTSDDGTTYDLRMVDHQGKLEVAWSDPSRRAGLNGSGFAEIDQRSATDLTLHFKPRRDYTVSVYLHYQDASTWVGSFSPSDDDELHQAKLVRTAP